MCRPASFIVTEKKVFWSKSKEGHTDIIEEFGLKDTNVRGDVTLVRVEIVPPNQDYSLPFESWKYCLDQDMKPEWYDAQEVEKRCRKHLKEWRKCKVVMPTEKREYVKAGECLIAVYGEIWNVLNNATIYGVWGDAIIHNVWDSAIIQHVGGNATIYNVCNIAIVWYVCDNATIHNVRDSAAIRNVRDSATIRNGRGSATIQDVRGNAIIHNVWDSAIIRNVHDSAIIRNVYDSAVVISYKSMSPDILKSSRAVLIDRSGNTAVCYTGEEKGK